MADKTFIGNQTAVADVWTYQVVTTTSGTPHGLTRNGKTVSLTAGGSDTTATLATALQALLAASGAGEFAEYSWTVNADTVTGTAQIPGVPATFAKASGVGSAATLTNATPAAGPNFFNDPVNWTGGTLPATSDRIVFDRTSPDALYGLTWLRTGPTVPVKVVTEDFDGNIGLPAVRGSSQSFSPTQGATYPEDRPRFLQLPAGTIEVTVGLGDDTPGRVQLDLAGTGTTVNVFGATAPAAGEIAAVYLQGTTGHPRLAVSQGVVGVALDTGSTGGFLDVLIGDEGNSNDALVIFGDGATVPQVHNQSGDSTAAVAVTSLVMGLSAGTHTQTGGNCSATQDGGTIDFRSTGTLTVTSRGQGTAVDFSKSPVPKGLDSSSTFSGGAKFIDPASTRTTGSGATFDAVSLPLSKLGTGVAVVK